VKRSRRTWSLALLAAGVCAAALVAVTGAGPARVIAGAAALAGLAALAVRAVLKLRAGDDSVLRRTPEMSTLAFPPSSLGK